jgi:glutamine synthetase
MAGQASGALALHSPPVNPADEQQLLDEIRTWEGDYVKVAVTDADGILRGKYLDKAKFLSATTSGFGFCDVVFGWDMVDECYDNTAYTGWHTGYPDAQVQVDLDTHRRIPWEDGRPFFLGEFVDRDGDPLGVCPRQTLKRVDARAHALGYAPKFGLEFEWFNFAETPMSAHAKGYGGLEPISPGMFGYSVVRQSTNQSFFRTLLDDLRAYGVPLEGLHCETGPGVLEVAILYSDTLEAADRAVLFKTGCKEIGARLGILPTFMARFSSSLPGCSGHHHQSLTPLDGGPNAFFDADGDHRMSDTFRSYVAGQLAYLPELLPMVAPTVNSYKRLVEGYWAPTRSTWGVDNRTVSLRVIPGSASSTRLETRVPGSDVNPYVSIAACLGAGLKGIEEGLTLDTEPIAGSGYEADAPRYPRTLQEATDRFAASTIARDLFGDAFVDHFAASREWEWRQSLQAVTDWELRRYFEVI